MRALLRGTACSDGRPVVICGPVFEASPEGSLAENAGPRLLQTQKTRISIVVEDAPPIVPVSNCIRIY